MSGNLSSGRKTSGENTPPALDSPRLRSYFGSIVGDNSVESLKLSSGIPPGLELLILLRSKLEVIWRQVFSPFVSKGKEKYVFPLGFCSSCSTCFLRIST